jgi:hypothetical protein
MIQRAYVELDDPFRHWRISRSQNKIQAINFILFRCSCMSLCSIEIHHPQASKRCNLLKIERDAPFGVNMKNKIQGFNPIIYIVKETVACIQKTHLSGQ